LLGFQKSRPKLLGFGLFFIGSLERMMEEDSGARWSERLLWPSKCGR
jgi:hypothetical protein